ncbi:lumenal Hsp70 protein [Ptychographa xylographoides]|nr:lumenal Hsp70 protein [Ptychographa xylographoides]
MPPLGCRRDGKLVMLLAIVVLFISTASAASAVLGIDLGTEYIKAALVKPGIPLEIVLTKDSKRKEVAAVTFKPLRSKSANSTSDDFPERLYGGDALALSARFPGDVYSNLKPLLGLTVEGTEVVSKYKAWHPSLNILADKERGTVCFKSESFVKEEELFSVEELLAMELQNIRANAEAFAGKGSTINNVVITVPVFFTAEEKRAVEVAADLAGLKILAMTSDGLSIGLNYATSRTFPVPKQGVKPEYHLVYDMGAGSTTATILRFQGKNVKDVGKFNKTIQDVQVMGVGWDRTLGGDAFNALILEDMISKFVESKSVQALKTTIEQIKQDGRTVAKLWKQAERLRQVLSANVETSASFEGLFHEDVSFKYKLSRVQFEKLVAEYTGRVRTPITRAIAAAKLGLNDIESIILHGGAVRTPFVQKELESIIGSSDKVRTNVNSDEAAVFGAAFKAAGISPSFRVKEIRTGDSPAHPVGISWIVDGKEKQQKLFQATSQIGTEKQVPLKFTEDFSFNVFQQIVGDADKVKDIPVSKIQTQNLTTSVKALEKLGCSVSDISTAFSIKLSTVNGLPEVTRASVSCEVVDGKKGGVVDNVKGLFGFGSKKGDQETFAEDILDDGATSSSTGIAATSTASTSSSADPKASDAKSNEKSKEVTKRIEVIYVEITSTSAGLPPITPSELRRMKDRMASFDASDRSRKLREEALNTLEGYTYKVRDLVGDDAFIAASTDKQRSEIEEKSKSASEWLYGDGADASRDSLKSRLKELRDLVDPIQKRKDEASKRPEEIKSLKQVLEQTKGLIEMVKDQSEKASEAALAASASSISAAAAQPSPEPTSTVADDLTDLDEGSSTTSAPPKETTQVQIPEMQIYTLKDLEELVKTYDSIQKWLSTKVAEQEKLSPFDDPVILSSDIATKSEELNTVVMNMMLKKMETPPQPKSTSKSKKSKTKAAKKSKTSAASTSTSGESVETDIPVTEGTKKPEDIKDEL